MTEERRIGPEDFGIDIRTEKVEKESCLMVLDKGVLKVTLQTKKIKDIVLNGLHGEEYGHQLDIHLGDRLARSLANSYIKAECGDKWSLDFALESLKKLVV